MHWRLCVRRQAVVHACGSATSHSHFFLIFPFLSALSPAQFVSLPTLVELHKTNDKNHLFKVGDLHQVCANKTCAAAIRMKELTPRLPCPRSVADAHLQAKTGGCRWQ